MRRTMKKSMMKSVFAIMATAMMSTANLCAQSAETTYIYGQEKENNLTVYTLNEDGKTLTRKLQYEYSYDEMGRMVEKKAYRWDADKESWKPAYQLLIDPDFFETRFYYAEWSDRKQSYCKNEQQSIYRDECNEMLLAYTQNRE